MLNLICLVAKHDFVQNVITFTSHAFTDHFDALLASAIFFLSVEAFGYNPLYLHPLKRFF